MPYRVIANRENNRNGRRRRLGCLRGWNATCCSDDGHASANKVSGHARKLIVPVLSPAKLNPYALTFDEPCFAKTLLKRSDQVATRRC